MQKSTTKILKHFTINNQKAELMEFKMELAMEAYIIENESVLVLDNNSEDMYGQVEILGDEIPLKDGQSDSDGRLDILALYSNETIAIIELKLGELRKSHLEQLQSYLKQKNNFWV